MSETPNLRTAELLSAAADNQLDAAERAELDAALPATAIADELAVLAALKQRLHDLAAEPLPPTLLARIGAQLDTVDARAAEPSADVASARRAPRPLLRRPLAAFAAVAALVLGVMLGPSLLHGRRETLELQPAMLAARHGDYHRGMHLTSSARPPEQMAAELSRNVGFQVRPPDLAALDARMVGCATCTHSVPSGRPVALFVMESSGRPLTLFEVPNRSVQVREVGFEPQPGSDVRLAHVGKTDLALRRDRDLDTVLAASGVSQEELLRMAEHAVRTAANAPTFHGMTIQVGWDH